MPKPKQFYWKLEELWGNYYKNLEIKNNSNAIFDFTPSEYPVFFDDNENNKPYFGLKYDAQIIEKDKKKIFLTDNHNKVLHFLFQQFLEKKEPIVVVHIDAHRDNAIFQNYEKCKKEIEEVKNYVKNKNFNNTEKAITAIKIVKIIQNNCRVSDYLDVALHIGFVKKVICITQEAEFTEFENVLENNSNNILDNFILNLDIDIYGEEGNAVSLELKTKIIAKTWLQSSAVCIATSPAFIEDELAKKCIEIIIS